MGSPNRASPKERTPSTASSPQQRATTEADHAPAPEPPWLAEEEPPIEAAASGDVSDDEFVANSVDSDLVSVSSSVYAHTYERGRRYQSFKNSRYPIPNDDMEQSREDMKHVMLMELTDGKLFFAPTGKNPQKIVDIGTGTGIWAIETGDAYPSASVIGIDLTPIQPLWVPPNVEFIVDDCERDWLLDNVDLAHFRFMAMILKDVPLVMQHAYDVLPAHASKSTTLLTLDGRSLRPGGWIEFQELLGRPLCDDGTMRPDDPFKVLYEIAGDAYARLGLSTALPAELEPMLLAAGFDNVHCKVIKVPIGTWAKDKTMRLVGLYQKTAVTDFISTLAGRPFRALGLSEEEAQVRLALARQALNDPRVHRYFNYYYWYAQKPEPGEEQELEEEDGD
ncbi:hypothetical protein CCM_01898 [Cordyceps militaris CM01]|uniref:S-adenosyl-L-methionine-dependent methyltransferase n=1 Tax=Cordyceps militaris (strain CM01) TaxID=983644 RepID=G3J2V9_CORMM|nr:uncharacterized protein CCM_01898 [Cordyceps militaris CM01]EGX97238.1 hypothetical protein CCM_01898 [Cordyceps militaris CM01]